MFGPQTVLFIRLVVPFPCALEPRAGQVTGIGAGGLQAGSGSDHLRVAAAGSAGAGKAMLAAEPAPAGPVARRAGRRCARSRAARRRSPSSTGRRGRRCRGGRSRRVNVRTSRRSAQRPVSGTMRSYSERIRLRVLQVAHAVLPRLAREGPVSVSRGLVGDPEHLLAVAEFVAETHVGRVARRRVLRASHRLVAQLVGKRRGPAAGANRDLTARRIARVPRQVVGPRPDLRTVRRPVRPGLDRQVALAVRPHDVLAGHLQVLDDGGVGRPDRVLPEAGGPAHARAGGEDVIRGGLPGDCAGLRPRSRRRRPALRILAAAATAARLATAAR